MVVCGVVLVLCCVVLFLCVCVCDLFRFLSRPRYELVPATLSASESKVALRRGPTNGADGAPDPEAGEGDARTK